MSKILAATTAIASKINPKDKQFVGKSE